MHIEAGGVHLMFAIDGDAPVRLLHLGKDAFDARGISPERQWAYRLVELRVTGEDHDYIEAGRYAGSAVGGRLRYVSHLDEPTPLGRKLEFRQRDEKTGLEVSSHLLIEDGSVECWSSVFNGGFCPVILEAVSSFFIVGLAKEGSSPRGLRTKIHVPRNGWYAEFQWTSTTASELGLNNRFDFGSRHETISSTGSWCSSNHLPMGYAENLDVGGGLLWEILHAGSWSWQIGETAGDLYLHVTGPTEAQSSWWKTLNPAERFESVRTVVAPSSESLDDAMAAVVRHRRRTHATAASEMPVIFNDYMNCLMGDPTEDKVLPLIDSAADLGAEVYCMDAGWYAEPGVRWSFALGCWEANKVRFPRGLGPIFDRVRELGMIPGIWFEIEALTDTHPGFADLPDDWFFVRHGRRVQSHRRYQLDFRNPQVREFANKALDMAVGQLRCGYVKLDYNFDSGAGSELESESWGSALTDHQSAFAEWLRELKVRYPQLLVEHCASGGQRLGRPLLDLANVASNSDEGEPLQIARIAAAATTMLLPERNGVWALPEEGSGDEATAFAMLCAIPYRMFVAGGAGVLKGSQRDLVSEALAVHKSIRENVAQSIPSWPLGLPGYHDEWICAALDSPSAYYLAVWHREGANDRLEIPVSRTLSGGRVAYPSKLRTDWAVAEGSLSLSLPGGAARLFAFDRDR